MSGATLQRVSADTRERALGLRAGLACAMGVAAMRWLWRLPLARQIREIEGRSAASDAPAPRV